jgi:hypothetical protein
MMSVQRSGQLELLQIEMSLAPQSRNVTWASDAGHGLRCGREAGLSVDGTEAEPATVRRGQAPEPRSGAPQAQGLRAVHRRGIL